ncbi:hypothetical protein PS847_02870 [Pseudomonas fluorescens]|uniref:Uncharacterized protein n=1 Tax=Pseudomonas fluorescens TaxID=294 RepID=A0A5E7KPE6_PSEFL|nr:hypothetical protein PS847_02870 [Pseudomonas fluorescens]
MHKNAVELALFTSEFALALLIKGDRRGLAAIHVDHIDGNVAQRDVVDRFELALDLHEPALRALDDAGRKLLVAATDRRAAIAEANDPLHAHQRWQVCCLADLVHPATEPVIKLFAVEAERLRKAVEFLLDARDGFHQHTQADKVG